MNEEKPVAVLLKEARQKLIDVIVETGINPSVMQYVIKDIYDMVCNAAEAEYNTAIGQEPKEQDNG